MKKLLQIEFIKTTRGTLFYVFIGLFMVSYILVEAIALYVATKDPTAFHVEFPGIWDNSVWLASWLNFFLGIMVLFSITSEFQYRTTRQHIVDGLSKEAFFVSKLLYAIALAIFAVIFVSAVTLITGLTQNHGTSFSGAFSGATICFRYFLQILGYMSLAMFIAYLFRNTALALVIYLFYMPIESFVGFIVFRNPNNYLPKTLMGSMVPKPSFLNFAQGVVGLKLEGPSDQTILILSCLYSLLFFGLGYWLLKRRNL